MNEKPISAYIIIHANSAHDMPVSRNITKQTIVGSMDNSHMPML